MWDINIINPSATLHLMIGEICNREKIETFVLEEIVRHTLEE